LFHPFHQIYLCEVQRQRITCLQLFHDHILKVRFIAFVIFIVVFFKMATADVEGDGCHLGRQLITKVLVERQGIFAQLLEALSNFARF
jgi:hypothetical protein